MLLQCHECVELIHETMHGMGYIRTCMSMYVSGVMGLGSGPHDKSLAAFAACLKQQLLACGMQPAAVWGFRGSGVRCSCNLHACHSSVQQQPGMSHLDTKERAWYCALQVFDPGSGGQGSIARDFTGLVCKQQQQQKGQLQHLAFSAPLGSVVWAGLILQVDPARQLFFVRC